MTKYIIHSIAIIALAIGTGCVLTSSTMVLTYHFQSFAHPNLPPYMLTVLVDLPDTIPSYDKHKDKIESIDAVSIAGDIANYESDSVAREVWISKSYYSTPHDVINGNSTKVFISPKVPPDDTLHISYSDGLGYFSPSGLDSLKSEIEHGGRFNLYVIPSSGIDITYDLDIVITMTAGL